MRWVRGIAFLVMTSAFVLNWGSHARAWSCDPWWQNEHGYSIICDTFPEYASESCPGDQELEEDCADWCWNYANQNVSPQDWGCSNEGLYQLEIFCGCDVPN